MTSEYRRERWVVDTFTTVLLNFEDEFTFFTWICCTDLQFKSDFWVNGASCITTLFPVEFHINFFNANTKIALATELLVMLHSKCQSEQYWEIKTEQDRTFANQLIRMMFNAYLSHNLCAHILHTDLQGKFWLHIDYKHANIYNIVRVWATNNYYSSPDWLGWNFSFCFYLLYSWNSVNYRKCKKKNTYMKKLFGQPASSKDGWPQYLHRRSSVKQGLKPCMSMDTFSVLNHLAFWRLSVKNEGIRERNNIKRRGQSRTEQLRQKPLNANGSTTPQTHTETPVKLSV